MEEKLSGVWALIKKRRVAPGKGVTEPVPVQGIRRFVFLLLTHPWKLVTLNLLFLAFCIPILTIPAALCGMNRVLIELVREGRCFLWSDFIGEFKAELFKSLPFGLLCVFLLFDSWYLFSVSAGGNGINMLTLAMGFFFLGFGTLFCGYAFVLLAALPLRNRDISKNTLILMATEWKTNLTLLGSALVMAVIITALFPYTAMLLLLIWFSLSQMIVCTAVNVPLQERIVAPYEEMRSQKAQPGQH